MISTREIRDVARESILVVFVGNLSGGKESVDNRTVGIEGFTEENNGEKVRRLGDCGRGRKMCVSKMETESRLKKKDDRAGARSK